VGRETKCHEIMVSSQIIIKRQKRGQKEKQNIVLDCYLITFSPRILSNSCQDDNVQVCTSISQPYDYTIDVRFFTLQKSFIIEMKCPVKI
jgi:hypothetical protein